MFISRIFTRLCYAIFGLFIGSIVHGLVTVFLSSWFVGLVTLMIIAVMLAIYIGAEKVIDWLFEKVFPSGISGKDIPSLRRSHRKLNSKKISQQRWAFAAGLMLGYLLSMLNILTIHMWMRS